MMSGWLTSILVLLANFYSSSIVLASELQWESKSSNLVQIINICEQHWVCASNIGCPDVVDVYDSIPAYSTGSTPFKKQCAVILQTKSSSFTLQFIEVQRQNGGGDCTLFAIANTVALCNKQDHHLVRYDQSQMRRHLWKCYEGGKHTPFPEKKETPGDETTSIMYNRNCSLLFLQIATH